MDNKLINKAGALFVRDRKVLLNRQGGSDVFIVPGGQIEEGETALEALIREVYEEFQIKISEGDLEYLGTFDSPAVHHPGKTVRIDLFLVRDWDGEFRIDNEIEGIDWFDSRLIQEKSVSPFFMNSALPLLLKRNLVD